MSEISIQTEAPHNQVLPTFENMSVSPRARLIKQLVDNDQIQTYVDKYIDNHGGGIISKLTLEELFRSNSSSLKVYEYQQSTDKTIKQSHILWERSEPGLPSIQTTKSDIIGRAKDWQVWADKPQVVEKANKFLISALIDASNFYPWKSLPNGFVVVYQKGFGMEMGSSAGIRVGFDYIKGLFKAIELGNEESIQREINDVTASIVHEMTHLEREEDPSQHPRREIASHISQYIFNPRDNELFNEQLEETFNKIEKTRLPDTEIKLDLYDQAQYITLMLIADEVSKVNSAVASMLNKDKDPNKLPTLRLLGSLLTDDDISHLKTNFLPNTIHVKGDELIGRFRETEITLGTKTINI